MIEIEEGAMFGQCYNCGVVGHAEACTLRFIGESGFATTVQLCESCMHVLFAAVQRHIYRNHTDKDQNV